MSHLTPRILSNTPLCTDFHELTFGWEQGLPEPLPGQFVTVRVSDGTTPLLRRPLAFSGIDSARGTASFICQKRGTATELLVGKREGDTLDLIGPLGNSFPEPAPGKKAVLVAGGIGLGPMLFLAKRLAAAKAAVVFVYGCRGKALIPTSDSFKRASPVVCTDDGSEGFHGTSVDYVKTLPPAVLDNAEFYACGPNVMMKACHEVAQQHGAKCWVSMEQVMACGVGACMGCAVRVKGMGQEYARVCADGPVFGSEVIAW